MNKRNKDEDNEDLIPKWPAFELLAKPSSVDYIANINKEFAHSEQFDDIVYSMENANEGDTFFIRLTTPGGALQAVIPLLNAMNNTLADVHVHVDSDVASAGTLILMCADSVSLNDYVEVMMHQVSFGAYGNGHKVEQQVNHTMKSSKKLCRTMYKHFLTPAELEAMLTGTEWYFDKEEFIERYNNRSVKLMEEIETQIAEMEAAANAPVKKPRKKFPKAVDVSEEL